MIATYNIAQNRTHPLRPVRTVLGENFGITARLARTSDNSSFQPLRELIERALVAYDWGESFIVTNAIIKPRIDRLVNQAIAGALATANGDPILTSIHFSLDEDAHWHREWTAALMRHIVDDNTADAEVVSGWIEKWSPLASEALASLADVTAEAPMPSDPGALAARITDDVSGELRAVLDR